MRESNSPLMTVPYGADQTLYLVIDSLDRCRSIEIERSDLETVIAEFMSGQVCDPVRVLAFNTLEHWSDDISKEVAQEIQTRCDIEGAVVPEHVRDFVERYTRASRQLSLSLV
jgi:hypothetical protein